MAYLSKLAVAMTQSDIDRLLNKAWAANTRRGITGALVMERGMFFQILEGTEAEVRSLFKLISSDSRHREIQLLMERPANERFFDDWAMAVCRPEGSKLKNGFSAIEEAAASPNPREAAAKPIDDFMHVLREHLLHGESTTV
ncbi:BLUF domain-containing protein [Sulfuriroseicoccus oceanibius]|uniref:BLUF domain-containing protein n=1 Tax=Sulfuriroseicoccus oceanibius TaxID=2707525 RepID=A0A6B3LDU1_9BACT|nr:BLUF domain-containing protein [Sulfuriroseicoccus oceanibius]QQL45055.1 BLUF domain-containing protein [Sulfuriroseicoccus oceanibius]